MSVCFQDVSCNEISHLPLTVKQLQSLKSLDLHQNVLDNIPAGKNMLFVHLVV